ncbi:MAG: sugar kinase, partial [Planctomycetes bacterium]|nr:sugar kinase [Planctomycetota bacterium]
MTLLVVGSTAFDTIETPHGTATDCLGGSSTYFSLA